jgi:hypothetical protein
LVGFFYDSNWGKMMKINFNFNSLVWFKKLVQIGVEWKML